MKSSCCTFFIVGMLSITRVFAGPANSDKEIKQAVAQPPCPQWYADQEWNISAWGTYIFTANDYPRAGDLNFASENVGRDSYLQSDHAWGGGADIKYFFRRYFGFGVEGWAVEARRSEFEGFGRSNFGLPFPIFTNDERTIGAALGTFTLRYPIPCSRFAPYVFAGGGAIFGGGERDSLNLSGIPTAAQVVVFPAKHSGDRTEAIGQFGGGIEVRVTPHIGIMSDFSWNVVDGADNNFGMVRTGVTFAF